MENDWNNWNKLTILIYIDNFNILINNFDLLIDFFDLLINLDQSLNQKEIEITSKLQSSTRSLTWNQICIIINNQIWTAWNLNNWQFDLGTLIS